MKNIKSLLLALFISGGSLHAQLLINEICPSNISIVENSSGHHDDYIELYNAGQNSINISGYRINDAADTGKAFVFPDYTMQAGSKILVFASGNGAEDEVDHYEMPVNGHGIWKYMIGSAALDNDWRELTYDDSSWPQGQGGIGYGDGDDGTVVPTCQSVMMRYTFEVSDSTDILKAIFYMDYDDGFTAYLNGTEIATKNMWPGPLAWDVFATAAHEALMYQGIPPDSFYLDEALLKSLIRNGRNVLAVQTHNVEPNSSDLSSIPYLIFGMEDTQMVYEEPPIWFHSPSQQYFNAEFKLSRNGETLYLFNPSGGIIDQQQYPPLESDHCYNRSSDGNINWCVSDRPTPMAANDASRCFAGYAPNPVFTLSGGFYSGTQQLQIFSPAGTQVYYTRNGDEPDSTDLLYTGPVDIDSSVNIRARVFSSGYLPGKTISQTYLVNEESHLPVFCISMDSLDLWDESTGIYATGLNADTAWPYLGANFWQGWRKPAAVEYFDKSKQRVLNFNAEIEIYGNYSRAEAQKSFELHLGDRFGSGDINYPLISDKAYITKYENIVIRNSGTDWNVVQFRDAMMERLMKGTYSGYLAAETIRLFLNGSDWGVYNVHEKNNHKWVETNYDLKEDEFHFLSEQGSKITAEQGSNRDFLNLISFATHNDPNDPAYYDFIDKNLDLKNYTDYFIAETFYDNGDWIGDWTNNIKIWKPKAEGSKWKYLLLDLDFGLGLFGSVQDNRLEMARNPVANSNSSNMFDAVLENQTFRKYFINRYADLMNTIYTGTNMDKVMHQFRDSMAFDMVYHFNKWGGDTITWQSNIDAMMSFAHQRPSIVRQQIQDQFSLQSQVNIVLNTYPPGSGRIEISTVTPLSYPWTGVYFHGNPVKLTAIPNPGFSFDHWVAGNIGNHGTEQAIEIDFASNDQVTAYFSGSAEDPKLVISEFNYHAHKDFNCGDWVELHNYGTINLDLSGWKFSDESDQHIFLLPTGTVIPANGYLVVCQDSNLFDVVHPDVVNRIGNIDFSLSNAGEMLRIFDYNGTEFLKFTYQTSAPWPTEADGGGYTCELINELGDFNDGNNWNIGCFGGSPGKPRSTLLSIPVIINGEDYYCEGSSSLLVADLIPEAVYEWKLNGTTLRSDSVNYFEASEEGTYSLKVESGNCSANSDPLSLRLEHNAEVPQVSDGFHCGPGQILLRANSNDAIYWYDSPGGELLSVGDYFITPSLTNSKVYYVRSGKYCPSNDAEALAAIDEECEAGVDVFPNPSMSSSSIYIRVNAPKDEHCLLQVFDECGKIILSKDLLTYAYSSVYTIPLQEPGNGLYFLKLYQGEGISYTKFLRLN